MLETNIIIDVRSHQNVHVDAHTRAHSQVFSRQGNVPNVIIAVSSLKLSSISPHYIDRHYIIPNRVHLELGRPPVSCA